MNENMNEFPTVSLQSPVPPLGRKEVSSNGVPTTLGGRTYFPHTWGWGCQGPGKACSKPEAEQALSQACRGPHSPGPGRPQVEVVTSGEQCFS